MDLCRHALERLRPENTENSWFCASAACGTQLALHFHYPETGDGKHGFSGEFRDSLRRLPGERVRRPV